MMMMMMMMMMDDDAEDDDEDDEDDPADPLPKGGRSTTRQRDKFGVVSFVLTFFCFVLFFHETGMRFSFFLFFQENGRKPRGRKPPGFLKKTKRNKKI